jgi:hypothetical protein
MASTWYMCPRAAIGPMVRCNTATCSDQCCRVVDPGLFMRLLPAPAWRAQFELHPVLAQLLGRPASRRRWHTRPMLHRLRAPTDFWLLGSTRP